MSKFDLIQQIGNGACNVVTKVSALVTSEPACTKAESWNMGVLVLVAVAIVLAVRIIQHRRRNFRDTYFW